MEWRMFSFIFLYAAIVTCTLGIFNPVRLYYYYQFIDILSMIYALAMAIFQITYCVDVMKIRKSGFGMSTLCALYS